MTSSGYPTQAELESVDVTPDMARVGGQILADNFDAAPSVAEYVAAMVFQLMTLEKRGWTLTLSSNTAGIEGAFQEALDLVASRIVSTELVGEIESLIEANVIVVLGDADVVDGVMVVPIAPSPQFEEVMGRLRQCPAA